MPVVVKIGGGLLKHPACLSLALRDIDARRQQTPLAVVPGGGPFADAVRAVDRLIALGGDEAHWMAILGMDQFAHLLAARLANGTLVRTRDEWLAGCAAGRTPVIAPYRWLLEADPLPHSWDVTSDSIAAWIAGQLGARELVLLKPPEATEPLLDPFFTRTLPREVVAQVLRVTPRGIEPAVP